MRTRAARLGLLVGLTAVGLACGTFLWFASARIATAESRAAKVDGHIAGILGSLAEVGSAQALYVAPGQAGGPWPARVTAVLARISEQVDGLKADGDEDLALTIGEAVDRLVAADAQVRQQLAQGDLLTATDLLSNGARATLAGAATRIRDVSETAHSRRAAQIRQEQASVLLALGGTSGLWLLGLIVLARGGASRPASGEEHQSAAMVAVEPPATEITRPASATAAEFSGELAAVSSGPPIDVLAAAAVSGAIARLLDAGQIQAVLAQAADVLDAQGAIVWLNTGERLQAVAAHGYSPAMLARVGDIEKDAPHVTAEAWREGALRTVRAYDSQSAGAIVAPMVAHDGCRGVLSLEVRHGRESDPTARAVALMFASQLAGVVAPAPVAPTAPAGEAAADAPASPPPGMPPGPADELAS